MNNENRQEFVQEDEIDLRELWATLMQRKKLILAVTSLVTILAIAYALLATPFYRVKAVLEMGQIGNKSILNRNDVIQKLKFIYEVDVKEKEIEYPIIESVTSPRGSTYLVIVQALGYSNKDAIEKLTSLVTTLNALQQKEVDIYIASIKEQIALIDQELFNNEKTLDRLNDKLDVYEAKVVEIEKKSASLAGILTIESGKIQSSIDLLRQDISAKKYERSNLVLNISPVNIKEAKMIGDYEVLEKPVKPKKTLIVVVAFITGLMLSVFLAFFLEFIKGGRKVETSDL